MSTRRASARPRASEKKRRSTGERERGGWRQTERERDKQTGHALRRRCVSDRARRGDNQSHKTSVSTHAAMQHGQESATTDGQTSTGAAGVVEGTDGAEEAASGRVQGADGGVGADSGKAGLGRGDD